MYNLHSKFIKIDQLRKTICNLNFDGSKQRDQKNIWIFKIQAKTKVCAMQWWQLSTGSGSQFYGDFPLDFSTFSIPDEWKKPKHTNWLQHDKRQRSVQCESKAMSTVSSFEIELAQSISKTSYILYQTIFFLSDFSELFSTQIEILRKIRLNGSRMNKTQTQALFFPTFASIASFASF